MKTLFALVSMDEVVCKQTEMMRRLLIIKQISGWGVWCVRACVRACVRVCVEGGRHGVSSKVQSWVLLVDC